MSSAGVLAITFGLLVAGVIGSIVPALPGALLSLLGVLFHWWATGYTTPGTLALVTFVGLAVAAMLVDVFGGAIAASQGGASKTTVVAAVAVSLVLAVFTGPLAILVGVPATVFVFELYRNGERSQALRAAFITTVGIFASAFVQVLLTTTLLLGFVLVVL
ncbi:DUF456 domain-containing protein [Halobacteriaceae bacterium SHR40]|uniref:DUF456 domain-containing protein n=1 Tax=Halovenus amylolytica TaxID=2500550 RepID=UPI000FE39C15